MENLTPSMYPEFSPEKPPNSKWKIFLAISLVCIIIGIAVWSLLFKNKTTEKKVLFQEISTTTPELTSTTTLVSLLEMADWKTYKNADFAYELKYPSDWKENGLNMIVNPDNNARLDIVTKTCDSYNSTGEFKESFQSTSTSMFYKGICRVGLSVRLAVYGNKETLAAHQAILEQILSTMKLMVDDSLWQTYQNNDFLFKFKYPKEFELKINEDYSYINIYISETNFFISATKINQTIESLKKTEKDWQPIQFQGHEALLKVIGDFCDKEIVFVDKGIKYEIMEPNSCSVPLDRRIQKIYETFKVVDPEADLNSAVQGGLIYKNEKYGFEFKYPTEWSLREGPITYDINPDMIVVRYISKNNVSKPKCEADDGLFLCSSTKITNAGNTNAYIYLDKGQEFLTKRLLEGSREYFQDYVDIVDKNGNKITIEFFSVTEKEESLKMIQTVLSTLKFQE